MKKIFIVLLMTIFITLSFTFNTVNAVDYTIDISDQWVLEDLYGTPPVYCFTITDFDLSDYQYSTIFIDIQNNDHLEYDALGGIVKSILWITDDDDLTITYGEFDLDSLSLVDMEGQITIDVDGGHIETQTATRHLTGSFVDYNLNIILVTDYTSTPPSTLLETFLEDNPTYILYSAEETTTDATIEVTFNTFRNNSLGGVSLLYYDSVIIPYGDVPNRPTDPPVPSNLTSLDYDTEFLNWGYSYIVDGETVYGIYDFETPITEELLGIGNNFTLSSIYTNKNIFSVTETVPPNIPNGISNFLITTGLDNLTGYLALFLFICIIIIAIVLLLKLPIMAFIVLSLITMLMFTVLELFPVYVIFILTGVYILIFVFSRKSNGGGINNG